MSQTERIYKIQQLLKKNRVVKTQTFLKELGVSRSQFTRDVTFLRDRMNYPIIHDRQVGGFQIDKNKTMSGDVHELPGLWFNSSEIHALLTMQNLLKNIEPGLLAKQIDPLKDRLYKLLEKNDFSQKEVSDRIRIVHATKRPVSNKYFELLATATLQRNTMVIKHYNREKNVILDREVSPQQLIFYRYNWYLDAWCHMRKCLRTFSVDAISGVQITDKSAKNVSRKALSSHFEKGYGIFAGNKIRWAKLRFSPESARWVSKEEWHGKQKSSFDKKDFYILSVPYSNDKEILMEILKHGGNVQVLSPPSLKASLKKNLQDALRLYKK